MNIIYLLLGLFIGLWLKSLISELVTKIAWNIVKQQPEYIAKIMNKKLGKDGISKFQQKINDAMEKAKKN